MKPGDTFRFVDPRLEPHLWIVLADTVIVSASTKNLGLDLPVIAPGEHPALGRRSYVRCDKARLVPADVLDQNLAAGVIRASRPLSHTLLDRVRTSVLVSPHTPIEVKHAIEAASPP